MPKVGGVDEAPAGLGPLYIHNTKIGRGYFRSGWRASIPGNNCASSNKGVQIIGLRWGGVGGFDYLRYYQKLIFRP